MRRLRAALLLLACVAGSTLLSWDNAEASSGRASGQWRAVAAPADLLTLSDYVLHAPGDQPEPGEGEDVPDTHRVFEPPRPPAEPGVPPPGGNPPGTFRPSFDSLTTRGRGDSLFKAAPVETIGPSTNLLPPPSGAGAAPPGPQARRGILGVHPLALLVGLIALHIFIVTVAVK
ncbi:MAG TPA: hypothetical protein VK527_03695 [Candidatus Limnocylindrales bacterium]|nr:hypothetical protein [Candidatus Limnocylindrales bacterium]